jgi:hypothetical protein
VSLHYGLGSRNGHQFANDESEPRIDRNGDISADGLTALVNLSQENHAGHQQAENLSESGMQTIVVLHPLPLQVVHPCRCRSQRSMNLGQIGKLQRMQPYH